MQMRIQITSPRNKRYPSGLKLTKRKKDSLHYFISQSHRVFEKTYLLSPSPSLSLSPIHSPQFGFISIPFSSTQNLTISRSRFVTSLYSCQYAPGSHSMPKKIIVLVGFYFPSALLTALFPQPPQNPPPTAGVAFAGGGTTSTRGVILFGVVVKFLCIIEGGKLGLGL